jgi:hypothetical protein
MKMLQEMRFPLKLGREQEFLRRKFHSLTQKTIGEVLDQFDLVVLILKYFIE